MISWRRRKLTKNLYNFGYVLSQNTGGFRFCEGFSHKKCTFFRKFCLHSKFFFDVKFSIVFLETSLQYVYIAVFLIKRVFKTKNINREDFARSAYSCRSRGPQTTGIQYSRFSMSIFCKSNVRNISSRCQSRILKLKHVIQSKFIEFRTSYQSVIWLKYQKMHHCCLFSFFIFISLQKHRLNFIH